MLSKKMLAGLNDQINSELTSSYLYLAMSAWFEAENLPGSARWLRRQSGEEHGHAMKIFDYVNDQDGRVQLKALAQPAAQFKGAQDVWEKVLASEQRVTASINRLYKQAVAEDDFATQALLQWFAAEQVEEEKAARTILEQVKLVSPKSSAMYFFDRHLGKEAAEEK